MVSELKEPFPEIKRKKNFCRYKITLQFLMYEKISFFNVNSPLSDAKKFLKMNNDKFEETVLSEFFICFLF